MLKEAQRLYNLGFAVMWLRPNSKLPIEKNWTAGPRKPWFYLKETYSKELSLNMGVRLGDGSKLTCGHYLAVVDCDVKSTDNNHQLEMNEKLTELIGHFFGLAPVVLSGRGNGSKHIYIKTKTPIAPFRFTQSSEKVKVHMPSVKPSKKEIEVLSKEELDKGIRLRAAWEISVMGTGQQVVLPPSIHPDSKKPYKWAKQILSVDDIPVVDIKAPSKENILAGKRLEDFEPVPVDLVFSPLSDRIVNLILKGEDCSDRSAGLMSAALAMIRANFTDQEILSVLTDDTNFLGPAAFDHAKTNSRKRAAQWVEKYTLRKAHERIKADMGFENIVEVEELPPLDEQSTLRQSEEIEQERDWREDLNRTSPESGHKIKPTVMNVCIILKNAVGVVFGRDEFAASDFYLMDTEWGGKKGEEVRDLDAIRIKIWLNKHFNVEPATKIVEEAIMNLAHENKFHPVREFLRNLEWDGVERVDSWLKKYLGAQAPEPYLSDISRKTLVAMIARVMQPGCKFDHILILEGLQDLGKSTAAKILADPWFSDAKLNIGDKDAVLTMQSKWLIEFGELSNMRKADVDDLKAFIVQQVDRIRAPYGKRTENFPRQCIFIGTTNNKEYLKDKTGNRRFWPVLTTKVDIEGLKKVRDQLLAEAFWIYENLGENLWLDNEESKKQAAEEQSARMEIDEWVYDIEKVLNNKENPLPDRFTMSDIVDRSFSSTLSIKTRADQNRIGDCLRTLGYERKRGRVEGVLSYIWVKK